MESRHLIIIWALFLACHITFASIFDPTVALSCKCSRLTSRFIHPIRYAKVEIFPAGVTCKNMEIIITLKKRHGKVCVNPESTWVQNLMKMMESTDGSFS